ncbi:bifunctional DNA primase/polymerase [Bradyrhizobium iriomotense]|uniref:bifunctional DNA primase/polymerase n=1 Tax=Bradyrhizobium iriomotense TaxID=441950 RepID=UPI001B8A0D39|nr:bifunctional DNA primase/polymerase [Bradyrhizobium iriomotense]MBR1131929.1 bifunctional DNA primase/polymerase [Bradyrhizobium iriomotense]
MPETPFAQTAPSLIALGYSPLPILPPDVPKLGAGKAPALSGWQKYCNEAPTSFFVAGYSRAPAMGVGVATGFGGLVAVDIDGYDAIIDPILSVLPPAVVVKIGRKGLTAFYRSIVPMKSRPYNDANGIRLLDFLSGGRQTVIPPSIHPDTGHPYYWWSDATLEDTPLEALPVLTHEHRAAMEEILRSFGWTLLERRQSCGGAVEQPVASPGGSDAASLFRAVNDAALANLAAWVPALELKRWFRAGSSFKAVAEWRPSSTGRALHLRKPNLSFKSDGIVDFGDGPKGYTPIDVVMEARRVTNAEALLWLAPLVGVPLEDPEEAALASRVITAAMKKKA